MMRPLLLPAGLRFAGTLLLSACAAMVPSQPAQLRPLPAGAAASVVSVTAPVPLRLATGYTRELPAGGRWQRVGSLPQGEVFRPLGTVFAVEGRHVHEAYLVLQASVLHGFYLPGEAAFSPLDPPVSLPLQGGAP